ncbi:MAG TPA: AarF/UbiB family protein, partial [Vicinamibacteria bacterium]|nr:AarF/UbiB family protein [Vicinamibacteria bacterium]
MGISLKGEHLKRYKDIASLFMKYGRSELVNSAGFDEVVGAEPVATPTGDKLADELAADLEKMGPTFVKLGQLLSTRADLLPLPYMEALARLQDKVEPFPFLEVEGIVSAELGVRLSKAFSMFEKEPVAAASLGQVHRAALRDGRQVAVKVQRPAIRERIVEDLDALAEIAAFADHHTQAGRRFGFSAMLEEFRRTLLRELDYRMEARNLEVLSENLRSFDRILVPLPVPDYTTSRVLTIDYIRGEKITKLSPLVRTEMDGVELAEQLFRAYLRQILVDGFVHADPHPGNVFLTDDNRIALLDLGMVARIAPGMQEKLLRLLLAVSEGRAEEAATVAITLGELQPHFDERGFRRDVADLVAQNMGATVGQIQVGRVVLVLARMSGERGVRVEPELTLLGKTLLNLDQVGRTLDPEFDPNAAIRRNAAELMRERVRKSLSPGNLFAGMMELKEFAEQLPRRINVILDRVASNSLEVKVDAIDERTLMEGFTKIANRITMGLVLAALIVGAAQLMQVETTFRILGYPGLAIVLFLAAAAGGAALVVD